MDHRLPHEPAVLPHNSTPANAFHGLSQSMLRWYCSLCALSEAAALLLTRRPSRQIGVLLVWWGLGCGEVELTISSHSCIHPSYLPPLRAPRPANAPGPPRSLHHAPPPTASSLPFFARRSPPVYCRYSCEYSTPCSPRPPVFAAVVSPVVPPVISPVISPVVWRHRHRVHDRGARPALLLDHTIVQ